MKIKHTLCLLISIFFNTVLFSNNYTAIDSIKSFINQYQYDKAINLIDKEFVVNSKSSELYYLKGIALRGMYNYNGAVESFTNASKLDSANNQYVIDLAYAYKLVPDYQNASLCFIKALERDPENSLLLMEKGNCFFLMELYVFAINEFMNIYNSDSTNYNVVKKIAASYAKLNQSEDSAIKYYNKAIVLNPNDVNNIMSISNLYILKREYSKGIALTERFISMDSTSSKVNSMNAYLYLLNKKYSTSVNLFTKCYQKGDSTKFVFKNLGIGYFKKDIFDSAKIFLEKAYFRDTADVNNLQFLGIACSQSVFKKLGITYLEKALFLEKSKLEDYSTITLNLVKACYSWSPCPCEKRLNIILAAIQVNPGNANLIGNAASEYDHCNIDKVKAIEYYTKFLKMNFPQSYTGENKRIEDRLVQLKKELKGELLQSSK